MAWQAHERLACELDKKQHEQDTTSINLSIFNQTQLGSISFEVYIQIVQARDWIKAKMSLASKIYIYKIKRKERENQAWTALLASSASISTQYSLANSGWYQRKTKLIQNLLIIWKYQLK